MASITRETQVAAEFIVIVDGATDGTWDVAQAWERRDRRVRVIWQENAGLSAARNAGAALARGKYLWFVDSDDIVAPAAAEKMVRTLERTGSDFAVGSYRRFDSSGPRRPGSWILAAHERTRLKTNAHQFPQILVNSVAWSKVYRRDFWDKHGLSFPVGAIYEDQPVSARAYALARSIDVLPDQIYHWRERDDRSSISQQTHQISDLDARLASALASLDELRRLGADDLVAERSVQLLANDIPHSMEHLVDAESEFWDHLAAGIDSIAANVPTDRWREIPSQHAALEWLLRQRDFDRARTIVNLEDPEAFGMSSVRVDDHYALRVPYWDDPDVDFPREVIALAPRHMRPMLRLRKAHWVRPGSLAIEGWAYLPFVAMSELDGPATARLIGDAADPHIVPLPMMPVRNPGIDRVSKHQVLDFRDAGFTATIDVDALGLRPGTVYRVEMTLRAAGRDHSDVISVVHGWGSAANLPVETSPQGRTMRLVRRAGRPAELRVDHSECTVESVAPSGDELNVTIRSTTSIRALWATPKVNRRERLRQRRVIARAKPSGNDLYQVAIPTRALQAARARDWIVRARLRTGAVVPVAWPSADTAPMPIASGQHEPPMAAVMTNAGNLGLRRMPPTAHIATLEEVSGGIRISGWYVGPNAPDEVSIGDHRHATTVPLDIAPGSRDFTATIPWHQHRWGRTAPHPTGTYRITLTAHGKPLVTSLGAAASAALPLWFDEDAPLAGRIERDPRSKHLVMAVEPTLTADERGARPRTALIRAHETGAYDIDAGTVLFRTYYGEAATGNALALHRELRRTRPHLRLQWAVKDSSVRIPDGGEAVYINSRRYFDALSTAQYLVDNVHQPKFFVKRPGQVFIQTLHGYPFKRAGLPYWESAGYGERRIASFLQRQRQWDYLISPAPYATPLLERDFPGAATMLEIGYPRNDIFFAPERHALRDHTRRALGIPEGATAVLYAPTYRDNLSTDEFRSAMVDFLDLQRASEALGSDFVILVRGHPMNARMPTRSTGRSSRVIDVTDYPEISELCLASDAAVLDYSSLRFDYALTGNPMVFLVPDLDAYRDDVRGWMLPYEETAPGPLVSSTDEVVDALRDLAGLGRTYAAARGTFLDSYMPLEDGHASERLIDAVIVSDRK